MKRYRKNTKIEIGSHLGDTFRLATDWKTLNFHIEVSPNKTCKPANIKEPGSYDLQINRNLDSAPATEVSLGDEKTWVAVKQGDLFKTTHLEIELATNRCDNMAIELRSDNVTVATKNAALCKSSKPQPIILDVDKKLNFYLAPGKTCEIWVNGKKIGSFNLPKPLSEYKISKLIFNDNSKPVESDKNTYTISRNDGEKKFEVTTSTQGELEIEKPECVRAEIPKVEEFTTTFTLNFQGCSEKLLTFRFKGKAASNQPFLDAGKTYIVKIDNETVFKSYISFSSEENSPTLKFQLTRDVDNRVEVVARLQPDKDYPLQIIRHLKATEKTDGNYVAKFPQSMIDSMQNDPNIKAQIEAGKTVPIIFKVYDESADGKKDPIGQFEVKAFGINKKKLTEITNSSQKFDLAKATEIAREILNIGKNKALEGDEPDAVKSLAEIINFEKTDKRSKTLKILSIIGNIGSRFLGIPLSF